MTNFENLKADIQKMTVEEFISTAEGIIYGDCKFCNYLEDKEKCKNPEFLCSDGVREWLESEAEEQHYNLYANALLSDGKLLFGGQTEINVKAYMIFTKISIMLI